MKVVVESRDEEDSIEVELTPEELAQQFWALDSEQMAMFFQALGNCSGDQHKLCTQMLYTRDACESHDDGSLECFQLIGASAFKYMDMHTWQQ